jgi:FtsP/CotA-like multicopper oxidase with cupredoxin domain
MTEVSQRVLTLTDWYHGQAPYLINYFQSPLNEDLHGGSEPVPNATLINEAQNVHFPIVPGRMYLFHIINMGAFASQYLQFDQHDMTIVEVDGVYTKPYKVTQLFVAPAQRYSVLVTAKPSCSQNFAIVASMAVDMFDPGVTPSDLQNNVSLPSGDLVLAFLMVQGHRVAGVRLQEIATTTFHNDLPTIRRHCLRTVRHAALTRARDSSVRALLSITSTY